MKKIAQGAFIILACINVLLILGFMNFYSFYATDHRAGEKLNTSTLRPDAAVLCSLCKVVTAPDRYNFHLHAKYRIKLLEDYKVKPANDVNCSVAESDLHAYLRSQPTQSNFTADEDFQRLVLAFGCKLVSPPDFLQTPPVPGLYDFEEEFISQPPFTDISRASNENTSSVVLLNTSSSFYLGDSLMLLVTMRDGAGRPKTQGGDEVRVWLTDLSDPKSVLPGRVRDLHNGTYLVSVLLAFVGKFRVTVALVYSREYIQTLLLIHLIGKSTSIFMGAFSNAAANETTVCYHVPVIPGVNQSEICNVTEVNGSPWFCGRPVKRSLSCTDYVQTRMLPSVMTIPLNEAETRLMYRQSKISPINGSLQLQVTVKPRLDKRSVSQLLASTPCFEVPPRLTWELEQPTGYLYKGTWHSHLCSLPQTVTKSCLLNLKVLLLGDSNGRAHYGLLSERSSCTQQILQTYTAWHKKLLCVNQDINFQVKWLPHSNPFRTARKHWSNVEWTTASHLAIDQIPSQGSHLVFINHYLHLTSSHISAYIQVMTYIKESLVRLLARNPSTFVIIQGPHVVWSFGSQDSFFMGDTPRRFYEHLLFEMFQEMRDRVFYLQTSDMTISTLSSDTHPPVNRQITDYLMGLFCGRHWLGATASPNSPNTSATNI